MNHRQLYREISLVLISEKIEVDCFNPVNLFKNQLVTEDELRSVSSNMRVSTDVVSFRTESFELLCDRHRFQLRSEDINASIRFGQLAFSLIRIAKIKVNAIGINAAYRFSLNDIDYLRFSHHCSPNNVFAPMAENAVLADLSFMDWNHPDNGLEPRTTYSISRLHNGNDGKPTVQISVNHHLTINDNKDLAAQYLSQCSTLHQRFFDKSKEFIGGIQ